MNDYSAERVIKKLKEDIEIMEVALKYIAFPTVGYRSRECEAIECSGESDRDVRMEHFIKCHATDDNIKAALETCTRTANIVLNSRKENR